MSLVALRAALFNVAFVLWTLGVGIPGLVTLLLPARLCRVFGRFWARGALLLLRALVGLRHEVRGRENLPAGPVLYACKHQSAWETIALHALIPDVAFVLKRELYRIPVFGWHLWAARMIAVDRQGGSRALRAMVADAKAVLADGRPVLIFPEGTRTPPGSTRPYHAGVAALYEQLGVTVVPVALNSGWFWARRAFLKRPGTITVAFLPPLPPGLPRRAFVALLRERIESATAAIAPPGGAAPAPEAASAGLP